jgi:glutathionyl-hydroquinone reductase
MHEDSLTSADLRVFSLVIIVPHINQQMYKCTATI